jgi:hypothetical protein
MTRKLLEAVSNWRQEAADEDGALFHERSDFSRLMNGAAYIVSGRKGAGKSAMVSYVRRHAARTKNCLFHALSATDFNYSKAHQLAPSRNDKIGYWREILLMAALSTVNAERLKDAAFLRDMPKASSLTEMNTLLQFVPVVHYKNTTREVPATATMQDRSFLTKRLAIEAATDLLEPIECYIAIDGLDSAFRHDQSPQEKEIYIALLEALLVAAADLIKERSEFGNIILKPIVIMRSDIIEEIHNNDKHKWYDAMINLTWDRHQIRAMLAHRIAVAAGANPANAQFAEQWRLLTNMTANVNEWFGLPIVPRRNSAEESETEGVPAQERNTRSPFDFIDVRTKRRPRDYVSYCREAAILALNVPRQQQIFVGHFAHAEGPYANLLRETFVDEAKPHMPDIKDRLDQLAALKKKTRANKWQFSIPDFVGVFGGSDEEAKVVLELLFKLDAVGYVKDQGLDLGVDRYWFHFKEKRPSRLDLSADLIVHPGIWKSLG